MLEDCEIMFSNVITLIKMLHGYKLLNQPLIISVKDMCGLVNELEELLEKFGLDGGYDGF